MKKRNQKKLSKLAKVFLVFCMVFTQFAAPVKIMAQEITDLYNIEISNTTDESNIVFTNTLTGDYLDEDYYIVKADLEVTYDNGKTMNEGQAVLVNGLLTSPNVEFTFPKKVNGTYTLTTNVYYVGQDISTITDQSYDGLVKYITDNSLESKDSITSEPVIVSDLRNELEVVISGTNVTGNATDGYNVPLDTEVSFSLTPYLGNYNPDEPITGHYQLIVNNTFESQINATEQLIFSDLYAGDYTLTFNYYNDNNELLLTKDVVIHYGDVSQNAPVKEYFNLDNVTTADEALNLYLSYTTLSDEQKALLPSDWEEQVNTIIVEEQLTGISDITFADGLITSPSFNGQFEETDELMTVSELKQTITDNVSTAQVIVYDESGNVANETSKITTGMKVSINIEGYVSNYTIIVKGDINGGLIDENEITSIIKHLVGLESLTDAQIKAADLNGDGVIDLKEASIYTTGVNDKGFTIVDNGINDNLSASIVTNGTNNGTVVEGDTFTVDLNLTGFSTSEINAIMGTLNYDNSVLYLTGYNVNNGYSNINYDNGTFAITTNENISIDSLVVSFNFTVLTNSPAGTYDITLGNTNVANSLSTKTVNTTGATTSVEVVKLSSNNNLSMLTPSTGTFDKTFTPDVTEYKLYVPSGTQTVTFTGTLADNLANTDGFTTFTLTGDTTVITITVTAEDGTTKTYTIEVIREVAEEPATETTAQTNEAPAVSTMENQVTTDTTDESNTDEEVTEDDSATKDDEEKTDDEEEEESSIDKIIIIILIILVILGLLYLIFKKDDDDEEENKKINNNKK